MLGCDHRVVGPAEEYLEHLRVQKVSPNTVKSYARALALWWQYLDAFGLTWDTVTLEDFGAFLTWLRTGEGPQATALAPGEPRFGESTVAVRLRGVLSCYEFHQLNGVVVGRDLHPPGAPRRWPLQADAGAHRTPQGPPPDGHPSPPTARGAPPVLTPRQIDGICEACAVWDPAVQEWRGSVRDRLLWALLAETGLRLGEALGLRHRDWHTGRGDTPFIEVVPREHPHRVRVKGGGYRKLYISDELDRLYGEYLWQLCDAGADVAVADLDDWYVFVNLAREPRFAPWQPDSVYDLVDRLRRQLAGRVPGPWTPPTALLLAGVPVHVVSRRLGHADVQTTLNTYAHVTEDAELRAVADWKALTSRWRATIEAAEAIGPCS